MIDIDIGIDIDNVAPVIVLSDSGGARSLAADDAVLGVVGRFADGSDDDNDDDVSTAAPGRRQSVPYITHYVYSRYVVSTYVRTSVVTNGVDALRRTSSLSLTHNMYTDGAAPCACVCACVADS